jgi:hypothetical protein
MNPDCLPYAGASRPAIKRPAGKYIFLDLKSLAELAQF